jgi:hypothetical protein
MINSRLTRLAVRAATIAALGLATLTDLRAADAWIHVDVFEGEDGTNVKLNLPLSLIEAVLPAIQDERIQGGRIRIDLDQEDRGQLRSLDLKSIMQALREQPDGDFVRVRDRGEQVRVAKSGRFLLVNVDGNRENADRPERVRIKLPIDLASAIAEGDGQEVDLVAMVRALARHRGEDLVSIEDGQTRVRIWVDDEMNHD